MTYYDLIQNMSVDEMARLLTAVIHARDVDIQKQLAKKGVAVSLIELAPDIQAAIHKEWLESEVQDDDDI